MASRHHPTDLLKRSLHSVNIPISQFSSHLGTAFTVFIISYAYTRIIEHYPSGGGGYIVATHTISQRAGVVSGSALLIDYMLTITVSIAACADAIFSFLPYSFQPYKLVVACLLIIILIEMNLRGVKESVMTLAPIFLVFIAAHALLLGYGIFAHAPQIGVVADGFQSGLSSDLAAVGMIGVLAIFLRAYSLGGGTYTGIEAVANGMQIMREPKVKTGKRTMGYMAFSLAILSGGLFLCYLLWNIHPVPGQTLNAVLATNVFGGWPLGGVLALVTILSEGALLFVAAQTGFIDGPTGDGKYGNRFVAPPILCHPLGTAHDDKRDPPHGRIGTRPHDLFARVDRISRHHVRHQCVHHVFPVPVRYGTVLL